MSAGTSRLTCVQRAPVIAFLVVGCGALATTTALAQQSIVVGGSLTVLGNPSNAAPLWNLVGDGISVLAAGGDSGSPGGAECTPCRAGRLIGMGGVFAGTTLGSGQAVVNGALVFVYFAGNLAFHANPAVMPDFDGNTWRNVTVPFSMGAESFLQYRNAAPCPICHSNRTALRLQKRHVHVWSWSESQSQSPPETWV